MRSHKLNHWLRWLSGSPLCGIKLCADVEAIEEGRKVWQIGLHSHDLTSRHEWGSYHPGQEVMTHSRLGRFCNISLYHKGHATKQYLTNKMCWHSNALLLLLYFVSFSTALHTSLASVWTWWLCTLSAQESMVGSLYKRLDASWWSDCSGVLWLPCAICHPKKLKTLLKKNTKQINATCNMLSISYCVGELGRQRKSKITWALSEHWTWNLFRYRNFLER